MSTDTNAPAPTDGTPGGETSTAGSEFKPITSQDEFNEAIKARLERERSKFSDYYDLRAKASKLDELEDANKSELEKANGRATSAETERDTARAEALRLRVAVKHGLSLEDADLLLTGSDEKTLTAQAERLSGRDADRKKNGNVVPKEGANPPAAPSDERAFVRELFSGG